MKTAITGLTILGALALTALLASPANAAATPAWHTCTRQAALVVGSYRFYNDWWGARTCIRVIGRKTLIVETSTRSRVVVAYPDIQFGSAYGYTTPGSALPVRISRMGHPLLTGTLGGHARGAWIGDFDSWFFRTSDTSGHGNYEMIIVPRHTSSFMPWHGRRIVGIAGHRYWIGSRETCLRPGECWPLIRFVAVRQFDHARLPFARFVYLAKRHGYLPRSVWWGSTDLGFENISGGRGETVTFTVHR